MVSNSQTYGMHISIMDGLQISAFHSSPSSLGLNLATMHLPQMLSFELLKGIRNNSAKL